MKHAASARIAKAQSRSSRGFALATVLIASTVMLTVLVVSVQATAAIRQSLLGQYYSGLARDAAESGLAYAKSCLASNASNPGAPTWSSSKPLQVNTGCDGNVPSSPSSATCLASSNTAGCTVASNGDVTSNFSVAYPTTNTDASSTSYGDATSLQSTGIVNVLITTQVNTASSPWRTYKVTMAANLVTPNLCSPYNTSTTGWSNVANVIGNVQPISGSPAYEISTSTWGYDKPGPAYYETSFSVANAGTYTLSETGAARNEISIDGVLQVVTTDSSGTASVSLSSGCHTIVAKVTVGGSSNAGPSGIAIALRQVGSTTDILDTESDDTKWRVTTGLTEDYSQVNYYDDVFTGWSPVRVIGNYASAGTLAAPTNWISDGGNADANWINSTVTLAGANQPYSPSVAYPSTSYINLRSSQGFTSVGTDPVKLVTACDDQCTIYVDGNQVLSNSNAAAPSIVTLTNLTAGPHEVAALLYNNTGASGFIFTAYDATTHVVLSRSDATWESTNTWTSNVLDPQSYDATFVPPNLPTAAGGSTYPTITNLATNPSFETNTTNVNARNASLSLTSSYSSSGTTSLAVTPNVTSNSDTSAGIGLDSGNGMQLGMIAGHEYNLSATLNIPTALSGTLDLNGRIAALSAWYYTTGYAATNYTMATAPNVAGSYNLNLTFLVPSDATQAYIRLYDGAQPGGGSVDWDAVSLTDITNGPAPASYHDGTAALYPGWSWNGTAQNSTSSGPYYP